MTLQGRLLVAVVCLAVGAGLCGSTFFVRPEMIRWFTWSGLFFMIVGSVQLREFFRIRRAMLEVAEQEREARAAEWYDVTSEYHKRTFPHEGRLSSLPEDWQRELAAIWRLEADVNNGAYLQFLQNWGKESYHYAAQGLRRMGAYKTAELIDRCQASVDEHFDFESRPLEERGNLMPNRVIALDGTVVKEPGSLLPENVVKQIYDLSFAFMNYPEDLAQLGMECYVPLIEKDLS